MTLRNSLACAALMVLVSAQSIGQTTEAWLDYFATFIRGDWTFEANTGASKGWNGVSWTETYLTGNVTYQPLNWLTTEGNAELHYTFNKEEEDVLEFRPWAGLSFIWPTFGEYLNLFYPLLSLRLEERFLSYQESGTTERKTRFRLRLMVRFLFNNETMMPGTYYLVGLVEDYVPIEGEAREVSADRKRFQLGLGYVVWTDTRVELQYILMRTRDSYANAFENSSNIVWLSVRNFF